jgi:hypothetical protein
MDSLFGLLAPHKSASVDRSQKLLDNGLSGSNARSARLTHNKSNADSPRIRLLIAEFSLQDLLQVGLLLAASEKKSERYQPSLPAVHSLQSDLASKNRDKWAEFANSAGT